MRRTVKRTTKTHGKRIAHPHAARVPARDDGVV